MSDPHSGGQADETPEARFGAELRRVRVQAGVKVRDLAKDFNRGHTSLSEFETGKRLPSVEVVEQYEDRFGLARGTLVVLRELARVERLQSPRDGTLDEHLGPAACPYMGLQAFDPDDAPLFFGRETQADAVAARLPEARFLAVIGDSGSGKSSFVRAALVARIGAPEANGKPRSRAVLLTPGEHPLDHLATAVSAETGDDARILAADLRDDPDALIRAIRRGGGADRFVLVIDQFEELFTLCRDAGESESFVAALLSAWSDPADAVTVILALRADFYGRVTSYPKLEAVVLAEQILIGPMSPADLRRAIELPAAACGLQLQVGLAQTIVEDLASEPGALPLLSHALLETWKRRRRSMLTFASYAEAGGVRGAIAQTADNTLQGLSQADRVIARSIFLSLTEVGDGTNPTRRRVNLADLGAHRHTAAATDRVLGILAEARLVTIAKHTVTVAHEALIRHWPTLMRWLEEERDNLITHRRLTEAAREWNALDREPGALYRGARLAAAREWANCHTDHLSQQESDFLTAAETAEHHALEAGRRSTRRLRVLAGGLAALTSVVAVLAVWALAQRSAARDRAAQATSLALAASALPLLDSRPDVALLLAAEAYRERGTPEARTSALLSLGTVRTPGSLAILRGHAENVNSVAVSPDGRTVASAGRDETIRLWDIRTHKPLGAPLRGHTDNINAVKFSPDGRMLASTGSDSTIRLWRVRTHKQIGAPLAGQRGGFDLEFSPDGRTLASAGFSTTVRLWDVHSRKPVGALRRGHTQHVRRIAFTPDGRTLASAGDEGTIRLWNVRTRKPRGARLHSRLVHSVAFSPDGRTLAAGGGGTIRLWDVQGRVLRGRPLSGHTAGIRSVAFSPNGRTLASAADDETVRLWDVQTHRQRGRSLRGHTDSVYAVAFAPDGRKLVSGSSDATARVWDAGARETFGAPLKGHEDHVSSVAFSPDRSTLASSSWDKSIRLWDVRSQKPLGAPLTGHTKAVNSVAFSPDGRTLASGSADTTIRLWDVRGRRSSGAPLADTSKFHYSASVTSVAFSPDGRTLASGSLDRTIRFWDVRTRKPLGMPLAGHTAPIDSVAFSPDGRTLASGGGQTIRLWDVRTRTTIGAPLGGATRRYTDITSVVFSPDGRALASGSSDTTVRLWDARTRKPLGAPLARHTWPVTSVAFAPDGRTLASGSGDKTIRLWDVRSRKPIGALLPGHALTSVAFSPDGRSLAAGDFDGTIRVWENIVWRSFAELREQVCALVSGGLGRAEWAQYAPGIPYRRSCT